MLTRRTRISIETWDRGVAAAPTGGRADGDGARLGRRADGQREVEHYRTRVEAERESQTKPDDDHGRRGPARRARHRLAATLTTGPVTGGPALAGAMPMTILRPGGPAVSRIGLGLAALGRPAYITSGRAEDLPDRSVDALRKRSFAVLDAAYAAGVRYFDAARSYGRAEEFLGGWLDTHGHPDAVCGSKWGYRYTGDWRLDAAKHEVKEHSLAMFTAQLAETRALLGPRLALYQVHSLTEDSPLLGDAALLDALGALRDTGVRVGLSTSGPAQAVTLRRAMSTQAATGSRCSVPPR